MLTALADAGFQYSQTALGAHPMAPWELHRSGGTLRRDGNRITYQSGSERIAWTVDISGADEGGIDHFLNFAFGVLSERGISTLESLNHAMSTDYGPCFNLGRLIWAGRKLAANRPLRRRLWGLRYRLQDYRRWMEDPILDPDLRQCAELLCAAALLGALPASRAKRALVEVGEVPDSAEAHSYGEWLLVLKDVLKELPDPCAAVTNPPTNLPSDHTNDAVTTARQAIAQAIHELQALSSPLASKTAGP